MADLKIRQLLNAVSRITTANICWLDRHPCKGRVPLDAGMMLRHENMGVVEVGPGVEWVKIGDRASVPFSLAEDARQDRYDLDYGTVFPKGITIGSGQCQVKYDRLLRELIIQGQAEPSQIVVHELALAEAMHGYNQFDKRIVGCRKDLLNPGTVANNRKIPSAA